MKKILAMILASTMLIGLFAGCGGTGEASPSPSDTSPAQNSDPVETQGAEENKEPIWFAFTGPLTGDASQYGLEHKAGMELAVKYINENGGINGREVKYDIFDSKNDPKEIVEIARMIGEEDKYMWVMGDFSSACCMAAAPIYEEYGIVQMSASASASAWCPMNDWQFMGGSTQYADAYFIVKYAIQKYMGFDKIGVVHHNSESGMSALENITKVASEVGVTLVDTEAIEVGEANFSSVLSKLRQTDIQAIVIAANYTEGSNCIKQARDMGWDIPIMLSASSASDQVIEILGDQAEGVFADENFNRNIYNDPEYAELLAQFEEICGWTMTMYGALGYDTASVLLNAAERCGDNLTRANFRDTLAATTKEDFNGICGPIEFNEDGSLDRAYLLIQVKDGKWTPVTDYDFVD